MNVEIAGEDVMHEIMKFLPFSELPKLCIVSDAWYVVFNKFYHPNESQILKCLKKGYLVSSLSFFKRKLIDAKYKNFLPLYSFCKFGAEVDIVRDVIRKNDVPNINRFLHIACERGHVDIVKYLINISINPNRGGNPLTLASSNNRRKVVEFLINFKRVRKWKIRYHYNDFQVLYDCCRFNYVKVLEILLTERLKDVTNGKNDDYDDMFQSLSRGFIVAVKKGFVGIIKLLLEDKRCDPASKKNAAIRLARFHKREKIMELLLKEKRIPNRIFYNEFGRYEME